MPRVNKAEEAVTAVVAVVLMVGITVTLAAVIAIQDPAGIRTNLERQATEPPPDTGFFAQHAGDYNVRPIGPDDVPLASSTLVIVADGVRHQFPAVALTPQLPAASTVWPVGHAVCIAGSSTGCLLPPAQDVAFLVRTSGSVIVDLPPLPG